MKTLRNSLNISAIILCLAMITFAQSDWVGEYEFGEDGGESAGGSKIYISHTITITEKDGKLDAHIYSQGFQTSRDVYAVVKTVGNKIEFYYRAKGEDQYTANYDIGELLLSLERKTTNGTAKVLTNWNAFTPMLDANEKSGEVYFEATKNKTDAKTNNHEWVRYESKNKGLSIAFPAESLVNNVKARNRRSIVYGYENGVTMTFRDYKNKYNKNTLKRSFNPDLVNVQEFVVGKYFIRKTASIPGADVVSQTYLIASKNEYYSIQALSKSDNNPTFIRFLMSLRINGKPLFKNDTENNSQEKIYSVQSVKTSPEVIEALNRKQEKRERKVKYEFIMGESANLEDQDKYTRPAVIIKRPYSRLPFDALPNPRPANGRVDIAAKVVLLANGQVGDITFVKALSEKFARKCCLKSAAAIKFIPAQIDGKYVDSTVLVEFNYSFFTQTVFR